MNAILKETKMGVGILLVMFTMLNSVLTAQTERNTIKGQLTTPKGKPLPFATIAIEGTQWGTTTNEDGIFQLKIVRIFFLY